MPQFRINFQDHYKVPFNTPAYEIGYMLLARDCGQSNANQALVDIKADPEYRKGFPFLEVSHDRNEVVWVRSTYDPIVLPD